VDHLLLVVIQSQICHAHHSKEIPAITSIF